MSHEILVLKQWCFVMLRGKKYSCSVGVSSSSSLYWRVIWLIWETYLQEHARFLHTQEKRLDQYLCLLKRLNWAERRRLRMVREAVQSPTGSDLMSKKTWACFCSVPFLLCSDRGFLSPVGMDTGVIRPSIPPTPTHQLFTEMSFCCNAVPAKRVQTLSTNGHTERGPACVCKCVGTFIYQKLSETYCKKKKKYHQQIPSR